VKHFGATTTMRHNTPAAALPGGELVFVKSDKPQGQTKGRPLDHIGFEVKSLQAFCKTLATEGVHFDFEFHDLDRFGLKVAFLTDPDGTSIELTEGLAAK
jgi:catechol 2,3-dioxygenase-like lactoylglutathione lyase family enzyme